LTDRAQSPYSWRVFLRFLLLALVSVGVLAGFGFAFYQRGLEEERKILGLEEAHHLEAYALDISYNFKHLIYTLLFISDQVRLHQPFRDMKGKKILADDLVSFLATTELFDQVRLLDLQGMEVIRANYRDGKPYLVPEGQLQWKGDRYYFSEAIGLQANELYISPLDLNVEHGKVEKPIKPTIRFAMPVFDREGKRAGVIVLNYLADHLLNQIRLHEHVADLEIMLLNSDGYWLIGPNPDDEWGFMFQARQNRSLAVAAPDAWRKIVHSDSGQFLLGENQFVFTTIYPFVFLRNIPMIRLSHKQRDYFWKLISRHDSKALNHYISTMRRQVIQWSIAIAALLLVSSYMLALAMERRRLAEDQIRHLARYDVLTDLPNRLLFYDRLNQAMARARRHRQNLAVLFLDLNNFKDINDAYGHEAGDLLLEEVAKRLRESVRATDTVARMGGDEFTVILTEVSSDRDVALVAGKILATLDRPFSLGGREHCIGGSIGISVFPRDGQDADTLIKRADMAMYEAKAGRKSGYLFYGQDNRSSTT